MLPSLDEPYWSVKISIEGHFDNFFEERIVALSYVKFSSQFRLLRIVGLINCTDFSYNLSGCERNCLGTVE